MAGAAHLNLVVGDITRARVDAIVNAANTSLLGGGGVDGAIHRAAGPALLAACESLPADDGVRCPVGEARITTAGDLPARFVIHTVGPVYHSDPDPAGRLADAWRASLRLAREHDCRSVAFPAISCGVYGYPHAEAAAIARDCCADPACADLSVSIWLFDEAHAALWRRVLGT
jgi:O-acetyl-ADP-ribose deacetylase (regulator of RNase III)